MKRLEFNFNSATYFWTVCPLSNQFISLNMSVLICEDIIITLGIAQGGCRDQTKKWTQKHYTLENVRHRSITRIIHDQDTQQYTICKSKTIINYSVSSHFFKDSNAFKGCTHLGISKNKTEETENNLSTLLVFSHSNNDVEYLNIEGNIYDNNKKFQTYYVCCCRLVTKLCLTLLRPHGL